MFLFILGHSALMSFAAPNFKMYKFVICTEKEFAVSLGYNVT